MRAVIYTRVSKDRKRRGASVAEQEAEARLACAALGWTVVEVFEDNDRSASRYATKVRKNHARLLAHLAAEPVDVLVLWEASRGDRELERWAGLLNLCRRRGTRIHVIADERTYDLDRPNDWKDLATAGVDSQHESEKGRQRILRNVRANAERGRPHGKLAFGYARRYDERGNFVEQHEVPEQAAVLRELARRVLAGESLYAVARDLNARGLSSPGGRAAGWDPSEIKRLLINPSYAGKRVLRGRVVGDAVWPAIISTDDHHRLVTKLTDPARNVVTDPAVRHLLSGLARCGVCGAALREQKNRTIRGYTCRGGFCVTIKVEWLEGFVTDMVIGRLSRPDARDLFTPAEDEDAPRAAARGELAGLQRELKEAEESVGTPGGISIAMLGRLETRLAPLIADAERRAAPPPPPSPLLQELTEPGVDVTARWATYDIHQRREVIHALADVRVGKGRPGERSFRPERLGASRWVGDPMTWGEHWAIEGLSTVDDQSI